MAIGAYAVTSSVSELGVVRRAYARQLLAAAGVVNAPLEDAFAAVPREDYLGPGPWSILRWGRGYIMTPDADPVFLYTDDLVGLDLSRDLNNGQPSFLAKLLDAARCGDAEHVVHIGAGVGYYTAVMAELVGSTGKVTAIEIDQALARRAADNLAHLSHVRVIEGDGSAIHLERADVVFVNAGVTSPPGSWLEALAIGGRLILPLSIQGSVANTDSVPIERRGAVFRIMRRSELPEQSFAVSWISPTAIFPCASARDDAGERALAAALASDDPKRVTRLYLGSDLPPAERCWLHASDWCLAYH